METPFWYLVKNHKIGFKEFFATSLNTTLNPDTDQKKYTLFFLSCLFNHEKYLDSLHIVQILFNSRINNTHQLSLIFCLYFYILFHGSYTNEPTSEYDSVLIQKRKISLQEHFNSAMLSQWINLILTYCFDIGVIEFESDKNETTQIEMASKYALFLQEHYMEIKNKTVHKLYDLQEKHNNLSSLIDFFSGVSFPNFLASYRHDKYFFASVVAKFWPRVLYTLHLHSAFTETEIAFLLKQHEYLHLQGNIEFMFDYIEEFIKIFGKQHLLAIQLQTFIQPNPGNDALFANSYLMKISEKDRQIYFYQNLPVSNFQLEILMKEIREEGFEKMFRRCADRFILRYKEDLALQGYSLVNDTFLNSISIFLYEPIHWHLYVDSKAEGRYIYIFLTDELEHLRTSQKNPYTNNPLVNFPIPEMRSILKANSIISLWENILRRKIELSFS